MLIHELPQTPYTPFPLDWQIWTQENTMSDGPCFETKYKIICPRHSP